MASPWTVIDDESARARTVKAHEAAIETLEPVTGVRRLVQESWTRSLQLSVDPNRPLDGVDLGDDELREYRDAHPLALALPTIHRLLIRHTFDAGLIVAVGDQDGRLLWIDGDRALRRKAEGMLFVEGADWSERTVGTSAPGTALALDHGIQIQRAEHFNRIVHPWSCTAVPVHDPESGAMLGVIDITGGDDAVAPATLPLLEAAVAAVEAELHIRRLDDAVARPRRTVAHAVARPESVPALSVLGTEGGRLEAHGAVTDVTTRHAEILTLLAWHPSGLSADALALALDCSTATLRAEMVRLRKVLETVDASIVPLSRPYRIPRRLELDAQRVLAFLDRGAHRVALAGYTGQVLPTSTAPGIAAIRDDVRLRMRESLLTDASVDTLLAYARTDEAAYDVEVWRACLVLLPPKSPKRASVVSRLEKIEQELA
jgi:transcriptional regulator of acetoin/glycerol metabolism